MRDSAVIRLVQGQLCWYPPGAGDGPRALLLAEDYEPLRAVAENRQQQLVFAAPGAEVRLQLVPYQASEKRHILKSLPFLLEEQLAEDIDGLHFASSMAQDSYVAVALCRHELIRQWQDLLKDYGALSSWIPEPLLLPWQPGEWCLLVEGEQALLRTGTYEGLAVETSLLPAVLAAAVAAQPDERRVVLYGQDQAADLALLPDTLVDTCQWRRGDFSAALLIADEPRYSLNLLQGEYAPRLPLARWWSHWRVAAAVIAAAVLVQMAATWGELRELGAQNLALRQQVESSYRRAVPRGNAPDPERQIRRKLQELSGSDTRSGFVTLVEAIGAVVSGREGARIASINYNSRSGDMRMNIVASDYEAVEAIRLAIAAKGLEATMESSNSQDGEVRARMRVKS